MISAISWVPKGVAKSVPTVADPPSKEEIEELIKSGALERSEESDSEDGNGEMDVEASKEVDEVAQALAAADAIGKSSNSTDVRSVFHDITNGLQDLNMEKYDEEDDGIELFRGGLGDSYYPTNELDPYLVDKDVDDSEEEEDMIIKAEDSVVICACNEEDVNLLKVYIYEDTEDGPNMYVHHDIMISGFPLCTAWLDCPIKGGEKGNFLAVGSMEPAIEIWDLDVVDEVQPSVVLGGIAEEKKEKKVKRKKEKVKKQSTKYKEDSHTDAVLGLAWNKEYRNILASASADKLVKIWDVATGKCTITMSHHTDKVQAVAWSHHASQVLLSGSFDHTLVMKDGRVPSHSGFKWSVSADVESVAWDPHTEHFFVASLEDGTVDGFDIRTASSNSASKPIFTLHAHDKAVSTITYNVLAPNLIATGSMDKTVKLWDLSNNQPTCIASHKPKAGAVFSISFSEDEPFLLAIGGSKGKLMMWDTLSEAGVSRKFGSYKKGNNNSQN